MGRNRRLARITDSEDEEEGEFKSKQFKSRGNPPSKKKKKLVEEPESEEDDPEEDEPEEEEEEPEEEEPEEEEEEEEIPEAKPIGEVIKVTGKGKNRRSHFQAFEYDGNTFELEDSVLLTPEEAGQKPYVAIIKEITQAKDGGIHVLGQWFYRPEEAEKKGGGSWEGRDTRELFYSFHHDEIPAESVMHKCQAHFIPLHKQIPDRSVHPGFIVQKVYDTVEKKLWKLTDKDYEDNKQHEIDILVQKTQQRLGEIPDLVETEDVVDQEDKLKDRRNLKRKDMAPIDVSREDGETFRTDQILTADTPGSVTGEGSELYKTLTKFKALTGESIRDKWLERLLQAIQCVCDPNENVQDGNNEKGGSASIDHKEIIKNHQSVTDVAEVTGRKDGGAIRWPDDAVPAVVALEKAANGAFDYQKFNQKMRQMVFNLRSSARLTRRLINGELEASVVLHMSPNELKEGLTAQETAPKEPEESERMQMTDARCQRCHEKRVGLTDIIQAGARGDRYQLECIGCGNTWYAFRDEVSTLTIDAPSVAGNVGTAPWATKKFENVEKKLVSPRESEKPSPDIFQKTTAAKAPVLDQQTSFKKQKTEEAPSAAQNKSE